MKTHFPHPLPAGLLSHQAKVLRRYLDRLVNGWEYARERDLDLLDSMLEDLDREIRLVGEEALPAGVIDDAATARRALTRARATTEDARMRHLEIVAESVESLSDRVPVHV
jgi:hypothetical protein